jgi:hypothetical protein
MGDRREQATLDATEYMTIRRCAVRVQVRTEQPYLGRRDRDGPYLAFAAVLESTPVPVGARIGPSGTGVRSGGGEVYLPPLVFVRRQSQVPRAEHDCFLGPEPQ